MEARDKQFKFLEVNGRAWLWSKLAAFSSVNLATIQYYDITNDPRLDILINRRQDNNFFYVHDMHITLNNKSSEQRIINDLCLTKCLVPFVHMEGEWMLKLVYSCIAKMRRIIIIVKSLFTKQERSR